MSLILGCAISAQAAIISVNRADDLQTGGDGGCDLRDAIAAANSNVAVDDCTAGSAAVTDFIIINVAGPIQLSDELILTGAVSISPPLGGSSRVELRAAAQSRHLFIQPTSSNSHDYELKRLHFTGGRAGTAPGGAVLMQRGGVDFGTIHVADCLFEDNRAGSGGALALDDTQADQIQILRNEFIDNRARLGGAVVALTAASGDASFSLNSFRNNIAENTGSTANGGAVFVQDSSTFTYEFNKNQFIGNASEDHGGALDLRGFNVDQLFILNQNTFLHNQAADDGGALGLYSPATVHLYNNTFGFNAAARGGAVLSVGVQIHLAASTLVHNSASLSGANFYALGGFGAITRNVIAHPNAGETNCSGSLGGYSSGGGNVMDDDSCPFSISSDIESDPQLSGLVMGPNGHSGFKPTQDSWAVDRIAEMFCTQYNGAAMTQDVFNNTRPLDGDGDGDDRCDAGSVEARIDTDLLWADALGG